MPAKKYVKYYRTKDLGNGYYSHVAVLNAAGRRKFGTATVVDKIRRKGSKEVVRV